MSSPSKFPVTLLLLSVILSVLTGLVVARSGGERAAVAARPTLVLAVDPAAATALGFDAAAFTAAAGEAGVNVVAAALPAGDLAERTRGARVVVLVAAPGIEPAVDAGAFVVAAGNVLPGAELFVPAGENLTARTAAAAARLALGRPLIAAGFTPDGAGTIPTVTP